MQRLGVHTSISGGIEQSLTRAEELGCTTVQIFSHNPRRWKCGAIPGDTAERFRDLRSVLDIKPIFIHTSYLINLASQNHTVLKQSERLLRDEFSRADQLGADYLVLHPGSASGDSEQRARRRIRDSLNRILKGITFRAGLLLENTAGERGDVSSRIEELAEIIDGVESGGISGICLDTCHAFAAGYDITFREALHCLVDAIDTHIGLEKVKVIHLNDSLKDLGSRVDRHEHIGRGKIGMDGFRTFFSQKELRSVPLILETPKKVSDDDRKNLEVVRSILGDS